MRSSNKLTDVVFQFLGHGELGPGRLVFGSNSIVTFRKGLYRGVVKDIFSSSLASNGVKEVLLVVLLQRFVPGIGSLNGLVRLVSRTGIFFCTVPYCCGPVPLELDVRMVSFDIESCCNVANTRAVSKSDSDVDMFAFVAVVFEAEDKLFNVGKFAFDRRSYG